jgi:hypothetical protein
MYPFTASFALILITSTGAYDVAQYPTMKECLQVSSQIKKAETICVEKKPLDDKEVAQFMQFFNRLQKEMSK